MTTREMAKWLDTVGRLSDGKGLTFSVTVIDVRENWGKLQLHVTPVNGSGSRWIDGTSFIRFGQALRPADA